MQSMCKQCNFARAIWCGSCVDLMVHELEASIFGICLRRHQISQMCRGLNFLLWLLGVYGQIEMIVFRIKLVGSQENNERTSKWLEYVLVGTRVVLQEKIRHLMGCCVPLEIRSLKIYIDGEIFRDEGSQGLEAIIRDDQGNFIVACSHILFLLVLKWWRSCFGPCLWMGKGALF